MADLNFFIRRWAVLLVLGSAILLVGGASCGTGNEVILATTTSTFDSGLLDELVPAFEEESGYGVKVIAVGTGQALRMGSQGDADVLFVHAPLAEREFVNSGAGVNRRLVMHNDFIVVGPDADPAGVSSSSDVLDALHSIREAGATFVSRGDDSGTHKRELSLWAELGAEPTGGWYKESGQGMGATLQLANQLNGYTISDRSTYLVQRDNLDLAMLHEGDSRLLNIYHVIQVNPEKFGNVNGEGGSAFVQFIISKDAQEIIRRFGMGRFGQPLFFADGGMTERELLGSGREER